MTQPMSTQHAAERRDAARALLLSPVLTADTDRDVLALVRRHSTALRSTFGTLLGYPLVVEAGFARLVKAPLSAGAPPRPARRAIGSGFTPQTYAVLSLLCAALLAPETGEQVLVSTLVEQVRADAATAGIVLGDSISDQRHLVAAFRLLTAWGVIEETHGSVGAWGDRREEALLTVRRAMLPYLLARPLATATGPEEVVDADPDVGEQPRRSLRRKLMENPVVRREELTDAERDVLSRERTELARLLDDAFGLVLEVRAEGALTYDPDRRLTDVEFPGSGTVKQAALLAVDRLIELLEPEPDSTAEVDSVRTPGLMCAWWQVRDVVTQLVAKHARAWGAEFVKDTDRLTEDVADLLVSVGLATRTDTGLVLHPAAARHRPQIAIDAQAHRPDQPNDTPELTLFDEEPT